jgi:hypothetical protein
MWGGSKTLKNGRLAVPALAALVGVLIGVPGVNAAQRIFFADNAGHVNGIQASRQARANMLVPLDKSGQFSSKVIPAPSPWLKPGQTVTGVVGGTFTAQAAGDTFSATATIFPALKKAAINVANVGVSFTAQENPFCDGDVSAPTAPAGTLCVYLALDQLLDVAQDCSPGPFPNCTSGEGVFKASWQPIYDASHGFAITWTSAAKGVSSVYGVWAFTAPGKGAAAAGGGGSASGDD